MKSPVGVRRAAILLCALLPLGAAAQEPPGGEVPVLSVDIPRLAAAPTLEDFTQMKPDSNVAREMALIDGFRQNTPRDGDPVSQRTEAYLGYDDENVYIVFLCWDDEPERVRATLARRENAGSDDKVDVFLDTFNDQRRSYVFTVNPLGVQSDGIWVEQEGSSYDRSFDTVWESRGALTDEGFVIWIAVPFQSLRFSPESEQEWGLILARWVRRNNEGSFWPYVTSRIEGRLNQGATMSGIEDVSPGRNLQLIPYGFFRSFRALDTSGESPEYVTDPGEGAAGLDFKTVFRDSLVLDATLNPDFNQVESDEPQVTVNQRFEVFFPEKRPFFLENASFFETPIDLFFSRRIVDPQVGARTTGKLGNWAVGALYANDRAPGERVAEDDPLSGDKSQNAVFRITRDIAGGSSLGAIYTDWHFGDATNRVGGLDGRLRIGSNWLAIAQGVASSTRSQEGEQESGSAWDVVLQRSGRQFSYTAAYNDRSPEFRTALGFLPGARGASRPGRARVRALPLRRDFRGLRQTVGYRFRPEGDVLIAWGPDVNIHPSWRHDGSPLDTLYSLDMNVELTRQTDLGAFYTGLVERLRPEEFDALEEETRYTSGRAGFYFRSQSLFRDFTFSGEIAGGSVINLVPTEGTVPDLADSTQATFGFTWYTTRSIQVEGTYLYSGVTDRTSSDRVFDNHIFRAKASWQLTPRLTFRTIAQYNSLTVDPDLTSLEKSKNLNIDLLATYLVNPWTAVYVGYNNNQNNLDLVPIDGRNELIPTDSIGPDSWQFFIKASYLIRF